MTRELLDYHDYHLADTEWFHTPMKEDKYCKARCHYCKIPLKASGGKEGGGYRRPIGYNDANKTFSFGTTLYGHPACIGAEITGQRHIHYLKHISLLHKYLRMVHGYLLTIKNAPPREILPSFLGPLASFEAYGKIIGSQAIRFVISHSSITNYIPYGCSVHHFYEPFHLI